MGHVVGVVAAVLSGLESQAGAVSVRVLWPHRVGQLSERLCHGPLPSFPGRPPPRRRDPEPHHLDRLAASHNRASRCVTANLRRIRLESTPRVILWTRRSSSSLTPWLLLASSFSARSCSELMRITGISGKFLKLLWHVYPLTSPITRTNNEQ